MTCTLAELTAEDVPAAAALHQLAFPGFFLSRLGTPFLAQFYGGFVEDPGAVTVVARDEIGVIRGVAVGTLAPRGFFSRLVRKRWLGFVTASARAAVEHPESIPRLLRAIRYRGDGPAGLDGALLSSMCVDRTTQGSGTGQLLINDWIRIVAARQVAHAFLTTHAEGNDAVNRFHRSGGWQLAGSCITREGRLMNSYVLAVD